MVKNIRKVCLSTGALSQEQISPYLEKVKTFLP